MSTTSGQDQSASRSRQQLYTSSAPSSLSRRSFGSGVPPRSASQSKSRASVGAGAGAVARRPSSAGGRPSGNRVGRYFLADVTPTFCIEGSVTAVEMVSDRAAWTAEHDGSLRVRSLPKGVEVRTIEGREGTFCSALLYVVGQNQIWAAFQDGYMRIYDVNTAELVTEVKQHAGGVSCLVELEGTVYSGGVDWKICQWNPVSAAFERLLYGHSGAVKAFATYEGPTGAVLFSASDDATVRAWDPYAPSQNDEDRSCIHTFQGHERAVNAVEVVPYTNQLWSASEDATIRVWSLETLECESVLSGAHSAPVSCLLPLDSRMWSGDMQGRIIVWDMNSLTALQELTDRMNGAGLGKVLALRRMQTSACTRVWSTGGNGVIQCWSAEALPVMFEGSNPLLRGNTSAKISDEAEALRQEVARLEQQLEDQRHESDIVLARSANELRREQEFMQRLEEENEELRHENKILQDEASPEQLERLQAHRETAEEQRRSSVAQDRNAKKAKQLERELRDAKRTIVELENELEKTGEGVSGGGGSAARKANAAIDPANPGEVTVTHMQRRLKGKEWAYVMAEKPHELEKTFLDETSAALGVPASQISNLAFSKGSLVADFDLAHPSSVPRGEMERRLQEAQFARMQQVLTGARTEPKTGRDADAEHIKKLIKANDDLRKECESLRKQLNDEHSNIENTPKPRSQTATPAKTRAVTGAQEEEEERAEKAEDQEELAKEVERLREENETLLGILDRQQKRLNSASAARMPSEKDEEDEESVKVSSKDTEEEEAEVVVSRDNNQSRKESVEKSLNDEIEKLKKQVEALKKSDGEKAKEIERLRVQQKQQPKKTVSPTTSAPASVTLRAAPAPTPAPALGGDDITEDYNAAMEYITQRLKPQLSKLERRCAELEVDVVNAKSGDRDALAKENEDLKKQLEDAKKQQQQQRATSSAPSTASKVQKDPEIEKLKKENEDLKKQLADAKKQQQQRATSPAPSTVSKVQKDPEIEKLKKENEDLKKQLADAKKQQQQRATSSAPSTASKVQKDPEIEKLKKENEELKKQLADAKKQQQQQQQRAVSPARSPTTAAAPAAQKEREEAEATKDELVALQKYVQNRLKPQLSQLERANAELQRDVERAQSAAPSPCAAPAPAAPSVSPRSTPVPSPTTSQQQQQQQKAASRTPTRSVSPVPAVKPGDDAEAKEDLEALQRYVNERLKPQLSAALREAMEQRLLKEDAKRELGELKKQTKPAGEAATAPPPPSPAPRSASAAAGTPRESAVVGKGKPSKEDEEAKAELSALSTYVEKRLKPQLSQMERELAEAKLENERLRNSAAAAKEPSASPAAAATPPPRSPRSASPSKAAPANSSSGDADGLKKALREKEAELRAVREDKEALEAYLQKRLKPQLSQAERESAERRALVERLESESPPASNGIKDASPAAQSLQAELDKERAKRAELEQRLKQLQQQQPSAVSRSLTSPLGKEGVSRPSSAPRVGSGYATPVTGAEREAAEARRELQEAQRMLQEADTVIAEMKSTLDEDLKESVEAQKERRRLIAELDKYSRKSTRRRQSIKAVLKEPLEIQNETDDEY